MKKEITTIIVNYKVPHEILKLIDSIKSADSCELTDIIIVDNNSSDGSEKIICEKHRDIKWVALEKNIGFGKACNIGAKDSDTEFLLFINPDTKISANTLTVSRAFMKKKPSVGIMGPKVIYDNGEFAKECRRNIPTPKNSLLYMLKLDKLFRKRNNFSSYKLIEADPDKSMSVDAISGSYMFVRSELFKNIGGFDEDFFMYGEDIDICVRCKKHNFDVWYYPKTTIIHSKGKSSAKNSLRATYAFYDSMRIFYEKHKEFYRFPAVKPIVYCGIYLFLSIAIIRLGITNALSIFLPRSRIV